jgi:hypothetical protein
VKRAAIVGVFAVVMATTWTFLAAQSGTKEKPRLEPPAGPTEAPGTRPTFGSQPVPAEEVAADRRDEPAASPLQQRFIELSAKKARALSPEQLQKAVNDLDQEVAALNAWSKVDESARLLRDVAEKSPQTTAGRAAKAALKTIEQYRANSEPASDTPKEVFERRSEPPAFDAPPPGAPPAIGPKRS